MITAEEKLINKESTSSNNTKTKQNISNKTEIGKKPDVKNFNPSKKGNLLTISKMVKMMKKSI